MYIIAGIFGFLVIAAGVAWNFYQEKKNSKKERYPNCSDRSVLLN